ncbi:MAG: putative DNA binding domain-containing protein [Lachnospiraceae bacterium]|nr:putative DNA binding domain-containing protein [Lachnospiraceae bacterium]
MRIADLIGESTEYDKKEKLEERKPRSWLKSVSAFANGIGGALIFGVSDDETPVGLAHAKDVSEKISEAIKSRMDPVPQVVMENHSEGGKDFIILRIPGGQETPYYYVGDGNRIAYVRVGNESIPADATALKRLVLRGSHISYDSLPSGYSFEKLAFTKLRSVYRIQTGNELTDSDFISFELLDENGNLTNAGALLADDSPIRHSRLFCTRWYGLDKASGVMDALDDKEYSGSLISLLQNGEEFVKNNSKKRWKKTGSGRVEMPEYPEQAVHEALVNALIHRDYMEIGSEVHIDIFDDRLEIYSPGGMFDGTIVQDQDTDHIASKRRNPVIADIFSRMHFMERRGSGFKKIKADYRHAVNYRPAREPNFDSTSTSIFVTLYNLNYGVDIKKVALEPEKVVLGADKVAFEHHLSTLKMSAPTREKTLTLFGNYGYERAFSRADVLNMFALAPSSAGKFLTRLKTLGLIEAVEGQGNGKYKFAHFLSD